MRSPADPHELLCLAHLLVLREERCNTLVTPLDVDIEFGPLVVGPLNRQARLASELVAGIFEHIAQDFARHLDAFAKHLR